ncbi:MAG: hypothetical protein H0W83_02015 [Planctomycetes bacterium]|nr:hypothetical protein [Planctomycetota bacterium]
MTLDDLDDACAVRLFPADPSFDRESWSELSAGLSKLFAQFEREGRISAWSCDLVAGGAVVLLAWSSTADLSGCSHDKVARLLATHEERSGRRLLTASPIVVEVAGRARCVDRAALRSLCAQGEVGPATATWDLRVATLGAWRSGGRRPLSEILPGLVKPLVHPA